MEIALDAGDQLGEGPVWDLEAERLVRVDISNGLVHSWAPGSDQRTTRYDGPTGAVVLRDGPGWVVAIGRQLVLDEPDGRTVLAEVEPDSPDNRFNDCRADPQGRIWAGTLGKTGGASLYRLEPGGEIERVVADMTISNGIGWSLDGETMYYVDSPTQRIDAFSFDGASGAISERRPFVEVDPADGLPDGLQVDAEGGVWVALFGGAAVRRYSPTGELEEHVELPVTNATCPGFGGPDLSTLYVTSAKHDLSPEALAAEPLAGALLALAPGVSGRAPGRFAG